MDMAVTGLDITNREALVEDMHTLADGLEDWDLIQDLKSIPTASIPVIKAKVDLRKVSKLLNLENVSVEDPEAQEHGKAINDKSKKLKQENPLLQEAEANEDFHYLPIDITFDDSQPDNLNNINNDLIGSDPFAFNLGLLGNMGLGTFNQSFTGPPTTQGKTHLGIASCNLVKDYVNSYPCLREVSILLKEFLAVHEFNVAYKGKQYPFCKFISIGGISSYSAVILIVAYMNNFKLQQSPHITPSRLLMGFLDFYSNCFDSQKFGINILNDM